MNSITCCDAFNWIKKGIIAGGERPLGKKHLKELKNMGFNSIVCLQTLEVLDELGDYDYPGYTDADVRSIGLTLQNIPVQDGEPPTERQFDSFLKFVNQPGRVTYVHCYAGIGRTGCMLAAFLAKDRGLSGEKAIEELRSIWRLYIQTREQWESTVQYIDTH